MFNYFTIYSVLNLYYLLLMKKISVSFWDYSVVKYH